MIFVDEMLMPATVGRVQGKWSHLFGDDIEELHRFAEQIGLQRSWFQKDKRLPHYDVVESKRLAAINAGAVAVTLRQTAEFMKTGRIVLS
jgi:hypothetical protein